MPSTGLFPRVLFYVQHLLGIGHLARASRLAAALSAEGFAVTIVTGGMRVDGFPGFGIDVVELPPVKARDIQFSDLVDADGCPIDEGFKQRRRDQLLATLRSINPGVLIIEAYPFGRRQMRFELLPLLEAARAMKPGPLIVSSIRDILQSSRKAGRAEETVSIVEQFFDLIMIHGDPRFVSLDESFPLASKIAGKLAYTGLVAPSPPQPAENQFDVVVSCGGGAAAGNLLNAAIEAALRLGSRLGRWCLITGPNLPAELASPLPSHVEIFRFRRDFPALLAGARLSVSQAGYNTVCDILRARCRAVLIPFAGIGETEQPLRAARLNSLGLAHVVTEADLEANTLLAAVERTMTQPLLHHRLDLDGAPATARLLRQRVPGRANQEVAS